MSTDPKINRELGEKIRAVRKARGYTRESLAEQIDISSRFLADIEAGKVGASLITIKKSMPNPRNFGGLPPWHV